MYATLSKYYLVRAVSAYCRYIRTYGVRGQYFPRQMGTSKIYFVVIPHEISGYTLFFSFVARGIVVTCKTTDLVS